MSATMALVRIQLHFLKWPLVVLTACIIAFLFPLSFLKETLNTASALFVLIGAVVSGAMVFGEEYAHGAKDYMATRPVAPMHVLSVKVLMLLAYSIPAAVIVDDGFSFLHPYWRTFEYERMVPLVWGLLFGLSLWCAGAAILTKDTVRGMLYGPPTYFLACVLVWLLPSPFYKNLDSIRLLQGLQDKPESIDPACQFIDDIFVVALTTLTPVLVSALLICIHRSRAYQRLGIPLTSIVLFLLYMGVYSVAWYGVQCDATLSTQRTKHCCCVVDRTHGRLYGQRYDDRAVVGTYVYDLWNPDRLIQSVDQSQFGNYSWMFLHNDQFLGFGISRGGGLGFRISRGGGEEDIIIYKIDDNGELGNPVSITDRHSWTLRPYDNERLVAIDTVIDASGTLIRDEKGKPIYQGKLINLRTGNVEINCGPWSGRDWETEFGSISIDSGTDFVIYRVKEDLTREHLVTLSGISSSFIVDGNLIAMIPNNLDKAHGRKKHVPKEPMVLLCDARQSGQPTITNVPYPLRFYGLPMSVLSVLNKLGMETQDEKLSSTGEWPTMALGADILCVELFGRLSVWDISDINKPKWLGITPFDRNTLGRVEDQGFGGIYRRPIPIIHYPDGALGFLVGSGIVKLEFPALMKEAKS